MVKHFLPGRMGSFFIIYPLSLPKRPSKEIQTFAHNAIDFEVIRTFFAYLNDKSPPAYGFLPLAQFSTVLFSCGMKSLFKGTVNSLCFMSLVKKTHKIILFIANEIIAEVLEISFKLHNIYNNSRDKSFVKSGSY